MTYRGICYIPLGTTEADNSGRQCPSRNGILLSFGIFNCFTATFVLALGNRNVRQKLNSQTGAPLSLSGSQRANNPRAKSVQKNERYVRTGNRRTTSSWRKDYEYVLHRDDFIKGSHHLYWASVREASVSEAILTLMSLPFALQVVKERDWDQLACKSGVDPAGYRQFRTATSGIVAFGVLAMFALVTLFLRNMKYKEPNLDGDKKYQEREILTTAAMLVFDFIVCILVANRSEPMLELRENLGTEQSRHRLGNFESLQRLISMVNRHM
ncbi:hypothetical protein BDD12DRAFT_809751 [Trichophaea hybrida]|nr:hypothetical protein BDD12DRAFT_809751 [Trichophaea hybrida]